MANNNYATKADLNALRDATKADLQTLRDELVEALHDTETKLLKAFYGFAEAAQKRMDNVENAQSGITGLIATLDRRVTELEKKVNFPNAS